MDEESIALLKTSFNEVTRHKDEAAALFYERLFVLDPGLRRLFARTDLSVQGAKLMATLALVVNNLAHFEAVKPVLEALAIRHVGYGVCEEHYRTMGSALIQTFALFFAGRFTPELRFAWQSAYEIVSEAMIRAAYPLAETAPDAAIA